MSRTKRSSGGKGPIASQYESGALADLSADLIMKLTKRFDDMDQIQDRRFKEMDQRFEEQDKRLQELRENQGQQFEEMRLAIKPGVDEPQFAAGEGRDTPSKSQVQPMQGSRN